MKNLITILTSIVIFLFISSTLVLEAQTIDFVDNGFKEALLEKTGNSWNTALDINGEQITVDINDDGEIQIDEALRIYTLEPPTWAMDTIADLVHFTNVHTLLLENQAIDYFDLDGFDWIKRLRASNFPDLQSLSIQNCSALDTLEILRMYSGQTFVLLDMENVRYLDFSETKIPLSILDNFNNLEFLKTYQSFTTLDTSIDLSDKPNLYHLDLHSSSFEEIIYPSTQLIEYLDLFGNAISSFDKSIFPKLKYANLGWNEITNIDVTQLGDLETLYISNAFAGTSSLKELLFDGCSNLRTLDCSSNSLTQLDLSHCPKLEFLDARSNWDLILDTDIHTINLQNCANLETIYVSSDELNELDFSCVKKLRRLDAFSCDNLFILNFKNGIIDDPQFFSFKKDKLIVVGVDFGEDLYSDPTVPESPYINFTPSCRYYTLTGNVQADLEDDDCDDDDPYIAGVRVEYGIDTLGATFTRQDGSYTIYSRVPEFKVVPQYNSPKYELWEFKTDSLVNISFPAGTDSLNRDLCMEKGESNTNVEVTMYNDSRARPGEELIILINFKNIGNETVSGEIEFTFPDSLMHSLITEPQFTSLSENRMIWSYIELIPFEERQISFTAILNTPMDAPPVDGQSVLNFKSIVSPENDFDPSDNIANMTIDVVNSFDPNDIVLLEGECIQENALERFVHYRVRFENTGTAEAKNIVVRNIIDPQYFDISTLQTIRSSHSPYTVVSAGVVEFIFEDINLDFDDASNDGFVIYQIKLNSDIGIGDTFENSAEIYFDYNFPILTNTYQTIVKENVISSTVNPNKIIADVFPSPFKDQIHISSPMRGDLTIYSLDGAMLLKGTISEADNTFDVGNLKASVYIAELRFENGARNLIKLVKSE